MSRTQDLVDNFYDSGQFCWGTINAWVNYESVLDANTTGYILPNYMSIDIDNLEDWNFAELVFGKNFEKNFFKVESSSIISSGHLIRCINFAKKLSRFKDININFICRDFKGNYSDKVTKNGFNLILLKKIKSLDLLLDSKPQSQKQINLISKSITADFDETKDILINHEAPILIVDCYFIDYVWQKNKKYVEKIIVIDDLVNKKHYADYLINPNLGILRQEYYLKFVPRKCKIYSGANYSFIRDEFIKLRKKSLSNKKDSKKMMIF